MTKTTHTSRYFYGKELSRESLKRGFISWADYFQHFDMVLCNKLPEVLADRGEFLEVVNGSELIYYHDGEEVSEEEAEELREEGEEIEEDYTEVYQYYIISDQCFNAIRYDLPDQLVYYCDSLDLYVLGVQHYGTSWTGVFTDIKIELNEEA